MHFVSTQCQSTTHVPKQDGRNPQAGPMVGDAGQGISPATPVGGNTHNFRHTLMSQKKTQSRTKICCSGSRSLRAPTTIPCTPHGTHASVANAQAGSVPFRLMCIECQLLVVHGDGSLELQVSWEPGGCASSTGVWRLDRRGQAQSCLTLGNAASVLSDGRARLPFLRVWLTRMRHRPILRDRFLVQDMTTELANQVVQLFWCERTRQNREIFARRQRPWR